MSQDNEIKAKAIKEFVTVMIGAFDAGFVATPVLNFAQLYQVAKNHCKDEYGIEIEPLDKSTYNSCNVKCN